MSPDDEERLNDADAVRLGALFDYVEAQGWCPMPDPWNRLWEMLLARGRECGAPLPGPPLILAAWHEAPPLMKRVRLLDQIEWATEYGILDAADRYLRGLPKQDWFEGRRDAEHGKIEIERARGATVGGDRGGDGLCGADTD